MGCFCEIRKKKLKNNCHWKKKMMIKQRFCGSMIAVSVLKCQSYLNIQQFSYFMNERGDDGCADFVVAVLAHALANFIIASVHHLNVSRSQCKIDVQIIQFFVWCFVLVNSTTFLPRARKKKLVSLSSSFVGFASLRSGCRLLVHIFRITFREHKQF